ncbi:unnamed protein product [Linum trigynum]|uniref:Transmembrane protein n=1 Tax=Linum trigynum TaxID=586398 RepID=A0AAV2DKW9_9ROSI
MEHLLFVIYINDTTKACKNKENEMIDAAADDEINESVVLKKGEREEEDGERSIIDPSLSFSLPVRKKKQMKVLIPFVMTPAVV